MTDLNKLVKPLVWRECGDTDGVPEWEANSLIGQYRVTYIMMGLESYRVYGGSVSPLPQRYQEDFLAKAAAQADYTARIIAALDPEALAKIRADALLEAAELVDDFRRAPATAGLGCDPMIEAILAMINKEDQA